jgi:hypothetical protein
LHTGHLYLLPILQSEPPTCTNLKYSLQLAKFRQLKKKVACGVGNQGTQRKCWFLFMFFFTGLIAIAIAIAIMQSFW